MKPNFFLGLAVLGTISAATSGQAVSEGFVLLDCKVSRVASGVSLPGLKFTPGTGSSVRVAEVAGNMNALVVQVGGRRFSSRQGDHIQVTEIRKNSTIIDLTSRRGDVSLRLQASVHRSAAGFPHRTLSGTVLDVKDPDRSQLVAELRCEE